MSASGRRQSRADICEYSLAGYPFTPPVSSLDGRVDTLDANLRLTSDVAQRLRLNAAYVLNDRDDKTPQASYTWVTTDVSVNPTPRTNLPYRFTQSTLKLNADYRATKQTKASLGFDSATVERTYQEVSKTRENTVWAKLGTRAPGNIEVALKAAQAERTISNYEVLAKVALIYGPSLCSPWLGDGK